MGEVYIEPTSGVGSTSHQAKIAKRHEELRAQLLRVLPPQSKFTWEIGCGHGHFLTAYALAHPQKLCIGIDIVSERIARAQRKRDRAKLENLYFLHAEASLFLGALPAAASFSELFILFPDPWPKLRHHKHRIMNSAFLSVAANQATENSQLCFRTDFSPYFDEAQRIVSTHPQWKIRDEQWPFEFSTVFQNRAANYQSLIARRRRADLPA